MLVNTTKGEMSEDLLQKKEGVIDNENECTTWVEFWHDGELVHRSAHVTLKKVPEGFEAIAGRLFGQHGVEVEGIKADGTAAKIG